jgi:ribA/ribD-fused uncharacterized protein
MLMKTGVIKEFRGEHLFLSNFYQNVFDWRGKKFFCAEQAFQYAKTWYPLRGEEMKAKDMAMRLYDTGNGATARKYGREIPLDTKTWDMHKVALMREIIHAKFKAPGMVGPLLNTGACMLVEGNDWGDKFWGRCLDKTTGKMVGLNVLGTLLMEERGYWLYSNFEDKK